MPEELFADLLRGVLRKSGRGENAGAGSGCQRPHGAVHRALQKSGVSRMWDESDLDHASRPSSGSMAASLGTDQDDQPATSEPSVGGVSHRPTQGDSAGGTDADVLDKSALYFRPLWFVVALGVLPRATIKALPTSHHHPRPYGLSLSVFRRLG